MRACLCCPYQAACVQAPADVAFSHRMLCRVPNEYDHDHGVMAPSNGVADSLSGTEGGYRQRPRGGVFSLPVLLPVSFG